MCTVLLPPGVNPIAVNKYIDINKQPYVNGTMYTYILMGWYNRRYARGTFSYFPSNGWSAFVMTFYTSQFHSC